MKDLVVTAIQSNLVWENPEGNRLHFDMHLASINTPTDIVVLPEMFTTGFTMSPEIASEIFDIDNMATLNWMRMWAQKLDAVITGSVSVAENGKYYNRLLWVRPDGTFSTYDKRHTFTFAGEHLHYTSGSELLIEEWCGWKICPLICYDLRFPVWSRNKMKDGKPLYDVMLYVANWPAVRIEVWKKLLFVRAIENQCYLVGINRVGEDPNGNKYVGDSAFINARGEYIYQFNKWIEEVATRTFSLHDLEDFRAKFPVLNDADAFELL
jgi:predicted amidohydrolase